MNIEEIVSIYQKCGFTINKRAGHYFLNRRWINYSFPLLSDCHINWNIVNSIKWKFLLSVIKIESRRKNTYEYILKVDDYNLNKFIYSAKKKINKSLRECSFKRPSLEDLIYFGLKINRKAMLLQKRNDIILTNFRNWKKHVSSFYSNENTIILGAYINDRMVGYIITCKFEGKYFNHLKHFDRQVGSSAPMQGLIFSLVNQIIAEKGHIELSDGMESYKYLPELIRFKRNMLFERIPSTRVYVINPLMLPFLQFVIFFYVHILKHSHIRSKLVQKMISLYQGHRLLLRVLQ